MAKKSSLIPLYRIVRTVNRINRIKYFEFKCNVKSGKNKCPALLICIADQKNLKIIRKEVKKKHNHKIDKNKFYDNVKSKWNDYDKFAKSFKLLQIEQDENESPPNSSNNSTISDLNSFNQTKDNTDNLNNQIDTFNSEEMFSNNSTNESSIKNNSINYNSINYNSINYNSINYNSINNCSINDLKDKLIDIQIKFNSNKTKEEIKKIIIDSKITKTVPQVRVYEIIESLDKDIIIKVGTEDDKNKIIDVLLKAGIDEKSLPYRPFNFSYYIIDNISTNYNINELEISLYQELDFEIQQLINDNRGKLNVIKIIENDALIKIEGELIDYFNCNPKIFLDCSLKELNIYWPINQCKKCNLIHQNNLDCDSRCSNCNEKDHIKEYCKESIDNFKCALCVEASINWNSNQIDYSSNLQLSCSNYFNHSAYKLSCPTRIKLMREQYSNFLTNIQNSTNSANSTNSTISTPFKLANSTNLNDKKLPNGLTKQILESSLNYIAENAINFKISLNEYNNLVKKFK